MNLLFICKHNCFRSKVAEAYFNKINKNKHIHVKSAGLIKGSCSKPITVKAAREMGLQIKGCSRGLSSKILVWQNMTVIVANNVPPEIFNHKYFGKPLIIWKIKDTGSKNKAEIKRIIKIIIKKVDKLVLDLKDVK